MRRNLYCQLILLLLIRYSFLAAQPSSGLITPGQMRADSLFFLGDWKQATPLYESVINETPANTVALSRLGYCYHQQNELSRAIQCYKQVLANHPGPLLMGSVSARLARVYCLQKNEEQAMEWLQRALTAGYANYQELDTNADFAPVRENEKFKVFLDTVYVRAFPCMADSNARQFDFWVGEWNVYINGTNVLAGHSRIEISSGGCMILENWTSVQNTYSGKSMNFYIPATGKWEQVWIGSEGSPRRPSRFENGEYKDGAMRFEFSGTDQRGHYTGRFIFYNLGKDKVRQLNEQSYDGGKTWQTNYDLLYVRRK
jgi:tetratricopeptide (TPR) repeat protein